jgi:hypothetical protein
MKMFTFGHTAADALPQQPASAPPAGLSLPRALSVGAPPTSPSVMGSAIAVSAVLFAVPVMAHNYILKNAH